MKFGCLELKEKKGRRKEKEEAEKRRRRRGRRGRWRREREREREKEKGRRAKNAIKKCEVGKKEGRKERRKVWGERKKWDEKTELTELPKVKQARLTRYHRRVRERERKKWMTWQAGMQVLAELTYRQSNCIRLDIYTRKDTLGERYTKWERNQQHQWGRGRKWREGQVKGRISKGLSKHC